MSNVSAFQPLGSETVKHQGRIGWLRLNEAGAAIRKLAQEQGVAECDQSEFERALLSDALGSGDVRAILHGSHGRLALRTSHNFSLNMEKGVVYLEEAPGDVFYCELHSSEFSRFLLNRKVPVLPAKSYNIRKAIDWLADLMKAKQIDSNDILSKKVKAEFGLSYRQYRDARKKAIELTGRHDLSKSGRRPKAKIET